MRVKIPEQLLSDMPRTQRAEMLPAHLGPVISTFAAVFTVCSRLSE